MQSGRRPLPRSCRPAVPWPGAWEELYIAEGCDWFWWYGDDHSSAQDALFDYLFRKHLQNVYLLLGDEPPTDLARPIKRAARREGLYAAARPARSQDRRALYLL